MIMSISLRDSCCCTPDWSFCFTISFMKMPFGRHQFNRWSKVVQTLQAKQNKESVHYFPLSGWLSATSVLHHTVASCVPSQLVVQTQRPYWHGKKKIRKQKSHCSENTVHTCMFSTPSKSRTQHYLGCCAENHLHPSQTQHVFSYTFLAQVPFLSLLPCSLGILFYVLHIGWIINVVSCILFIQHVVQNS